MDDVEGRMRVPGEGEEKDAGRERRECRQDGNLEPARPPTGLGPRGERGRHALVGEGRKTLARRRLGAVHEITTIAAKIVGTSCCPSMP